MVAPCSAPAPSYFATPQFLLLSLHGATAISVPIHLFGLYCILFKTPEQMKSVKWYFVNLHLWIVCYDYSVCLLTVPMILLPTMGGYPLGIFGDLGVPMIFQTVLVLLFLQYVLLSILAIFENRFHTVCTFVWKVHWTCIRHVWLGAHYIIGFLILVPFVFLAPDQNVAKKRIFEQLPCLPDYIYQAPVFVTADDYTYHMIVLTTFLFIGVTEAIIFITLLVFNTIEQLRAKKMSPNLFEIQKKFFIALVIQMMVPLLMLLIPLWYAFYAIFNNYYNQAITNIGVSIESCHGLVSSLVMIFIHRPYREAFFGMFTKRSLVSAKTSLVLGGQNNNNQIVPLRKSMNKV